MSKVKPGTNDIQTIKPFLLAEWDYEKNDPYLPSNVAAHSNKKYWWKCNKGHSWQATPNNRSNGYNCPYCSGRYAIEGVTDFATLKPELLLEWDYEMNAPTNPHTVTLKSNISYWWKCKEGHAWQDSLAHRSRGDSCPYCSGHRVLKGFNDLSTINPNLAKEWNYKKNSGLTPDKVTVASNMKVWWICSKGHEWESTIAHRSSEGLGCPYCSGRYTITGETDLATVNPVLAKEWNYEKNRELTPNHIMPNSEKRVWWICPICKNEWIATPASRNSGGGCPNCDKRNKTSFPEQAIFFYVRQYFADAENSYKAIFGNSMELDIFIPSISTGIEYDGPTHQGKLSDKIKYEICKQKSIKLIRISEIELEHPEDYCDLFIQSHYLHTSDGGLDNSINELMRVLHLHNTDINSARDRMLIYEQYLTRLKDNSLAEKYPEIANEWHPTKNKSLLPEMFNWGSGEKVWWKCFKGHEWQSSIASRTSNGTGCPICGREKVKAGQLKAHLNEGKNAIFTVFPELEKEWDYEKNTNIDTNYITPHSNIKAWWKCKEGHEWQATVSSRSYGTGCPYCSGSMVIVGKTDLYSTMPEVAKLWNYQRNTDCFPTQFSQSSNKKVWWKCEKGHEWQAIISSVSRGRRCPYCSGKKVLSGFNDLKSLRPDLMLEWNYEKNIEFSPSEVTEHSGKKAWWKCKKCGHEWQAVIDSRSKGHGCPICGIETVRQKLKKKG